MDVADRVAILDLMARYAHSYDEGRLEELGPLFTAEAVFRFDPPIAGFPAELVGRDAIAGAMQARYAATAPAQRRHIITNVLIDPVTDDRAEVASYLLLGSTTDGVLNLPVTGRYTDVVVRDEGRWRYAERLLRLDARLG